jgi:hypothetical protein
MSELEKLKNLQMNRLKVKTRMRSVNRQKRIVEHVDHLVAGLSVLIILSVLPETILAAKFDINAGVKAATDPLIKAIDDHWGKAVLLTGCAGAMIGEGDARQRAVRAAITSVAAGGVVLALLAMLT